MKMCTHSAAVDVCDNSHLEWCQDHGCEEYKKGDSKMNEWKRFEDEWPEIACPVWLGKNGLIDTIVPWCDTEENRNGSTHWKYVEVPEPPCEYKQNKENEIQKIKAYFGESARGLTIDVVNKINELVDAVNQLRNK
jgi:hypothetical protein